MTPTLRRLVAPALALIMAVGVPGAAWSDVPGQVLAVTPADETVDVVLGPLPLERGETVTSDAAVTSLDGKPVRAEIVSTGPMEVAAPSREVVLVLDTSGSMAGERMAAAKAAATAYLDAAPKDLKIGLVTFADGVTVRTAPTLDRTGTRAAITALEAQGSTSLYDGVLAALASLGTSEERQLLVLSDGADSSSASPLAPVVAALQQAKVPVDAVELGGDAEAVKALTDMAGAAGGQVLAAQDASQLTEAFVRAASVVQSTVTVRVPLTPQAGAPDVPLTVAVTSKIGKVSGAADVTLPAPPAPAAAPAVREPALPPWLLWSGLGSLFLAAVLALVAATSLGVSRGARARDLMAQYTTVPGGAPVSSGPDSVLMEKGPVARAAVELADKVAKRRDLEAGLALALDRAAIAWQPSEWLVLQGCLALTALALTIVLGHGPVLAVVLALLAGWALPKLVLRLRFARRRKAFIAGMPDALQLVAGSLTTGYSLAQALDASVQEGAQPVSGELGRALAEARLGVPLEDALEVVADRMDSEDFRWVVMAVRVQRDVGGNLAEVLTKVCVTMRDRASLRRQVAALSAEGRISAYVLIALPIFLGLYLFTVNRDYFRPMYTELPGMIALGYTAFSLLLGAVWMNKLVKVEM